MDGLGIRPEMHALARRLAAAGYYVVQPNLYYRAGRAPLFDAAKAFSAGPSIIFRVGLGLGCAKGRIRLKLLTTNADL